MLNTGECQCRIVFKARFNQLEVPPVGSAACEDSNLPCHMCSSIDPHVLRCKPFMKRLKLIMRRVHVEVPRVHVYKIGSINLPTSEMANNWISFISRQ